MNKFGINFNFKEYQKLWHREYRKRMKHKSLFSNGQCPECGVLLQYAHEPFHSCCPFYKEYMGRLQGSDDSPKVV